MKEREKIRRLLENIEKVIIGKRENIRLLVAGLIAGGHILIEDVPGVGKTMLALALAKSINAKFKRIQFTPDLLPSDVTGGFIYNQKTQEFEFREGPVFTNILLADEINRTTPRTQSALLECMQEGKVSIDGHIFSLPRLFMVIATQNPVEYQGTYPLAEAQIDRFLMKINMGYVSCEDEEEILFSQKIKHPIETVEAVMDLEEILNLQNIARNIEISPKVIKYIVRLVSSTRTIEEIKLGASPRASIALMRVSCAWALLENRDYVIPDDVIKLSYYVLRHRLIFQGYTEREADIDSIIKKLLERVPIP